MRIVWLFLGLLSLCAGIVGAFLPLLPTVPFLLLAAFFFARSSEKLHRWLIGHPTLGPPISAWQKSGAIGLRAKFFATASILASFLIPFGLGAPIWVSAIQALALAAVALFIWSRPSP